MDQKRFNRKIVTIYAFSVRTLYTSKKHYSYINIKTACLAFGTHNTAIGREILTVKQSYFTFSCVGKPLQYTVVFFLFEYFLNSNYSNSKQIVRGRIRIIRIEKLFEQFEYSSQPQYKTVCTCTWMRNQIIQYKKYFILAAVHSAKFIYS